jgi:hypothetical protein
MKNVVQKSLQGSAAGHLHGWVAKLMALAVGATCYLAVLSPSSASAQSATQLKYLQLMVVLTGEAPWFPAGATADDYVQWARNNGMRPTGGWNPDAPITTDIIAQTLSQLLGYNPRKFNGDYYRTLAYEGLYIPMLPEVTNEWLASFMDNPWRWSKKNPPSPKEPKDPKDPKDPKPKDPKHGNKDKDHGHKHRNQGNN